ncbi:MAG TPA: hypothetical protein VGM68_03260 [Rhizomicrobium sp.]
MRISVPVLLSLTLLAPLAARADALAPMALNSLSSVPAKITAARVVDPHGVPVGTVARIDADAKGKPLKVNVTLASGGTVAMDASALGYDESANVLVTATEQPQSAKPAPSR